MFNTPNRGKIQNIKIYPGQAQKNKAMRYITNLTGKNKMLLYDLIRTSSSFKVRQRAHALILSSKRRTIEEIADIFDIDRDTVSEWFKRWEAGGIDSLKDAPRSGRPSLKDKKMKASEPNLQAQAVKI